MLYTVNYIADKDGYRTYGPNSPIQPNDIGAAVVNNVQRIMGSTTPSSVYGNPNIQSTYNNPSSIPIHPPALRTSTYIPDRQDVYPISTSTQQQRRPQFIPSTFDGVFYPTMSTPTPSELPPFGLQENNGFNPNASPIQNGNIPMISPTNQPYFVNNGPPFHSPTNPFNVRNGLDGSSLADPNAMFASRPNRYYFQDIPNSAQIPHPIETIGNNNYDTVVITPPPRTYPHPFDVPHPSQSYLGGYDSNPAFNEENSLYFHSYNQL